MRQLPSLRAVADLALGLVPQGRGGASLHHAPQKSGVEFLPRISDGYNAESEQRARDTFAEIVFSDQCAKAFKAAGLATPFDLMAKGIVVGSAQYLKTQALGAQAGITEGARLRDRGAIGSRGIQAFTARDKPGQQETVDGRPRIFLNLSAFNGGTYSLREVLTHELIHVAGIPPQPGILGSLGLSHDLNGYEHYDAIIMACK